MRNDLMILKRGIKLVAFHTTIQSGNENILV